MTEAATAVSIPALDAEDHTQISTDALAGVHEPELAIKEADTNAGGEQNEEDVQDGDNELVMKKKLEEVESRAHIAIDKDEDAAANEPADESTPEGASAFKVSPLSSTSYTIL